jgi:hypothetical protein
MVSKKIKNQKKDSLLPQQIYEAGGDKKLYENLNEISRTVECLSPKYGEDLVKNSYELREFFESENPRVINPENFGSLDELCKAIKYHWINRLRNSEDSINKAISRAKQISNYKVFPVDFFDLKPSQAIAYLDYREKIEKAPRYGIRNDWKVIKIFAKAFGININTWNYRPPREIKSKVKIIPLPNVVYALVHHEYSKDPYENALYQYLMFHSFLIGMRNPSEIVSLGVSDIFVDDGYNYHS